MQTYLHTHMITPIIIIFLDQTLKGHKYHSANQTLLR